MSKGFEEGIEEYGKDYKNYTGEPYPDLETWTKGVLTAWDPARSEETYGAQSRSMQWILKNRYNQAKTEYEAGKPEWEKEGLVRRGEEFRKSMQEKERTLGTELLKRGYESAKAVDKELGNLLKETGLMTDVSKQAIASQQFAAGMGRSSFTGDRLASAELAGTKTRAGLYQRASGQKKNIEDQINQVNKEVYNRRIEIQENLRSMERKGIQSAMYDTQVQEMRQEWKDFVEQLELDAQTKMDLTNLFGAAGGLGGLWLGSKLGAEEEE